MRTTVRLDDDVAAAVEQARRRRGSGLSNVINDLIRAGLSQRRSRQATFRQRSATIGIRVDVSDTAEVLEQLDGPLAG